MTILLIDGNNIAHRVRHTHSLSLAGKDVSVTYGMFQVIVSYIKLHKPTAVMVAWDGGIPKFRRDAVPSYKANRKRGDDDPVAYQEFLRQIEELHTYALPLAGVHTVKVFHVEADDLLYHAACLSHKNYDKVVIASADEDLLQCALIADNVQIYNPNKKQLLGTSYIAQSVSPQQFVQWRALQGDSSDNIRGVPGIGPVRASKLFAEHGNLANIFEYAETQSGSMWEHLRTTGLQQVLSNQYIMELCADFTGSRFELLQSLPKWKPSNVKELKHWFLDNAFTSLMDATVYNAFRPLDMPNFQSTIRTPRTSLVHRITQ